MPRHEDGPEKDVERLVTHAAYCRRIGRHSLAGAIERAARALGRDLDLVASNPSSAAPTIHVDVRPSMASVGFENGYAAGLADGRRTR